MRSFLDSASAKVNRYSQTEIRILSTVPVAELQKQVDEDKAALKATPEELTLLTMTRMRRDSIRTQSALLSARFSRKMKFRR